MGIFDKFMAELIDIVEWLDDTRTTLVWRFPRYQNEIKNGAQLIVRPGQKAIFIDRGKIADIFDEGIHKLTTANLPILSTLKGWKHGFESPFKAEIYFVSTRQVTELKWGTANPIMMRDSEFGPVRIRAFGTYSLRAADPEALLRELVGTDHRLETGEINELMRSLIATAFAETIGTAKIPVLDLAANYQKLSDLVAKNVSERIDDEYGLEIPQFSIVNVSLPEAVEAAIDRRSSMGVMGPDLRAYQQFQTAEATPIAAANTGGAAGAGVGMGMGFAMANQMTQAMAPGVQSQPSGPPPLPQNYQFHYAKDGKTLGPVDQQTLASLFRSGEIDRQTLLWRQGMNGWQAAAAIDELKNLLITPPPLPSQ